MIAPLTRPVASNDPKADRKRLLAFAFIRSDILIEIDRTGVIIFVAGSTLWATGLPEKSLVGRKLTDVLMLASADVVGDIFHAFRTQNRLQPRTILFRNGKAPVAAWIAGNQLPGLAEHYFLSVWCEDDAPHRSSDIVSNIRDPATDLLTDSSFNDCALIRLKSALTRGDNLLMSMFELVDFDIYQTRLPKHALNAFLRGVGMILQRNSVNGDTAGRITDNKFSVLHSRHVDGQAIGAAIGNLAREADPVGVGLKVLNTDLSLSLDGVDHFDVGRALVYSVNQFSHAQAGSFSITSMSAGLKEAIKEIVGKVANFRSVIANNQFHLVFQPIVDLHTREIHHQEALTRLPDGSSPFSMVSFAEELGVVSELDHAVSRQVLATLDQNPSIINVAINLSGRSLENDSFMAALEALFQQYATVRRRMLIEITETSQVRNFETVRQFIDRCRAVGQQICLDDFGAGSAAFRYLRAFSVDIVKIDGDYIKNIATDQRDLAFVRSIVSLCKDLKIATVAEFCETQAQVDKLASAGVEQGQGFLFGKPSREIRLKRVYGATPSRAVQQPVNL